MKSGHLSNEPDTLVVTDVEEGLSRTFTETLVYIHTCSVF